MRLYSSFYGLLDLLSGTELNPGQGEIGIEFSVVYGGLSINGFRCSSNSQTVLRAPSQGADSRLIPCDISDNHSQIIDSILDYSKLEASGIVPL